MLLCLAVTFLTEITSNADIATLLMPIPAVATAPNAIARGTGNLRAGLWCGRGLLSVAVALVIVAMSWLLLV